MCRHIRQRHIRHIRNVTGVAGLLLSLLGIHAAAQQEDCDALSTKERPACWMARSCAELSAGDARDECLARANELRETLSASEPADPAPSANASSVSPTEGVAPPRQRSFIRRLVRRQEYDIPRRFTGVVTRQRDLVYDRQLIVIDDELLFEGENAAESALDAGDEVDVRRKSRFYGHSYRITGPTRRAVEARRILCEADAAAQSVDTRRKCTFVGD